MKFLRKAIPVAGLAVAVALAFAGPLSAQTGTISGSVQEAGTALPLAGAQVSVAAEGVGNVSNANGRFVLLGIPAGNHVLEIRYIGYRTENRDVTVVADETVNVDVQMESEAIALDEVVVTGTGVVTERRRLGATLETLGAETLNSAPASNITELLSGRITGMVPGIAPNVGTSSQILLRGAVSLTQRSAPLIYVDGVRIDSNYSKVGGARQAGTIDRLNPNDIERIEVIKGAAAATLYGTEASSGVIHIITKRGSAGDPVWTFGAGFDGTRIPTARLKQAWGYNFDTRQLQDLGQPALDYIGGWGSVMDYNADVRGGTSTVQYFASGRLRDEVGQMGREYRDFQGTLDANLRANLTVQATERLGIRMDMNTVFSDRRQPGQNGLNWGSGYLWGFFLATPRNPAPRFPYGGRYGVNAYEIAWPPPHGYSGPLSPSEHFLPLDSEPIASVTSNQDEQRVTLSGTINYDWGDGIRSALIMGRDRITEEYIEHVAKGLNIYHEQGERLVRTSERTATTLDFKTSWTRDFSEDLTSTLLVGGQSFWEEEWFRTLGGRDFPLRQLATLPAGSQLLPPNERFQEVINAGVYAQEEIGLWNRLFLNAGLRVDGNSAFGENFAFQMYPKGGASWVVSDHDFWPFQTWDQFRVRAALGAAGLQPGAFDATQTWLPGVAVNNLSIVRTGNPGNPDLKPERTLEWEFGTEFGFLDGRVGLDLVYYNATTSDALLPVPSASSTGFLQPRISNIGKIRNQGFESSLDVTWIRRPGLRWSTTLSAALNDSEILDMGGVPPYRVHIQGGGSAGRYYPTMKEGFTPGAWIAPVPDPSNPYTVAVPIEQLTRLNQITPNKLKNAAGGDSLEYVGRPIPLWTGSFLTSLDLPGGVSVNATFTGAYDYHMFSEVSVIQDAFTRNSERVATMEAILDNPNTSVEERQRIAEDFGNLHPSMISSYLFEADFIRFADLSVNYNVPERFLTSLPGMNSLVVRLSASNVYLWNKCPTDICMSDPLTPYHGIPDARSGGPYNAFGMNSDYGQPPSPRRYGIRFQATF